MIGFLCGREVTLIILLEITIRVSVLMEYKMTADTEVSAVNKRNLAVPTLVSMNTVVPLGLLLVGENKNLTNSFNCYTLYLTIRLNVKRGEQVWDYKIP